ncbi:MAG TPA: hypothetical protein H9920_04350, partial [Candidatus Alistipes faecavium]|nr:hypothetical protein [Candidatus Alistipes faecavium]
IQKRPNSNDRNGRRKSFCRPKTGFLSRRHLLVAKGATKTIRMSPCAGFAGAPAERAKEDQAFPSSCSERSEPRQIFFRATRKCGGDFYAQRENAKVSFYSKNKKVVYK